MSFTVSGNDNGTYARCTMTITGFSVSKEVQDSLFEPFALPLANVGTGLAFSVVKNLIENNKGRVSAVSNPEENKTVLELDFLSAASMKRT